MCASTVKWGQSRNWVTREVVAKGQVCEIWRGEGGAFRSHRVGAGVFAVRAHSLADVSITGPHLPAEAFIHIALAPLGVNVSFLILCQCGFRDNTEQLCFGDHGIWLNVGPQPALQPQILLPPPNDVPKLAGFFLLFKSATLLPFLFQPFILRH